jgi:Cu-processing system ATP-binding protein
MITITGLTKRFGSLDVLRGLDLEIRAGRVTAIVGPNGAGKTTLIKTMLGLTRADAGVIRLGDTTIGDDPDYRAAVGYMPQSARFPENLTGRELLTMLRDLRDPAAVIDEELLNRFRLERELTKPLRTLSGGTRQKVNAAMAFLFDPPVLILDEPTAGLDPVSSGVLKDKIRAARDVGKTFILTSHIISELEELADDVAFLLDGRTRFAGAVHDLKVKTRQLSLERAIADMMTRSEAA